MRVLDTFLPPPVFGHSALPRHSRTAAAPGTRDDAYELYVYRYFRSFCTVHDCFSYYFIFVGIRMLSFIVGEQSDVY